MNSEYSYYFSDSECILNSMRFFKLQEIQGFHNHPLIFRGNLRNFQ